MISTSQPVNRTWLASCSRATCICLSLLLWTSSSVAALSASGTLIVKRDSSNVILGIYGKKLRFHIDDLSGIRFSRPSCETTGTLDTLNDALHSSEAESCIEDGLRNVAEQKTASALIVGMFSFVRDEFNNTEHPASFMGIIERDTLPQLVPFSFQIAVAPEDRVLPDLCSITGQKPLVRRKDDVYESYGYGEARIYAVPGGLLSKPRKDQVKVACRKNADVDCSACLDEPDRRVIVGMSWGWGEFPPDAWVDAINKLQLILDHMTDGNGQ